MRPSHVHCIEKESIVIKRSGHYLGGENMNKLGRYWVNEAIEPPLDVVYALDDWHIVIDRKDLEAFMIVEDPPQSDLAPQCLH